MPGEPALTAQNEGIANADKNLHTRDAYNNTGDCVRSGSSDANRPSRVNRAE